MKNVNSVWISENVNSISERIIWISEKINSILDNITKICETVNSEDMNKHRNALITYCISE